MNASRPQRIICVGTGRDGTLSIADMFQNAFDLGGRGQRVMHEYMAREFYHAFSNYRETAEHHYLDEIYQMIDACPYDCIVGNGYASVLPLFAERWGKDTAIVHIRRLNRQACIASLKKNSVLYPMAYRYYSDSPEAVVKRMAAFHFGEMTVHEWNRLSAEEKFAWYYDKTHFLISSYETMFSACGQLQTENLNEERSRRLVARFATGDDTMLPPPVWINRHGFDVAELAPERRIKMQWLLGRLDVGNMSQDETYAITYFLEKFVAWTGYQLDGSIEQISLSDVKTREELRAILDRASRVVSSRMKDIETMRASIVD